MPPSYSPPTVLVVEDNEAARQGLAAVLRKEGYDVVLLTNGKQALDYLRCGGRPDLILLDMLLPVLDGWKVLDELEQWSKPVNAPIVVMTGTILTAEWAAQRGCAGFLRKPIEVDRLTEVVKRFAGAA
jgi:CheY-like chemotaxis protein